MEQERKGAAYSIKSKRAAHSDEGQKQTPHHSHPIKHEAIDSQYGRWSERRERSPRLGSVDDLQSEVEAELGLGAGEADLDWLRKARRRA